MPQKMPFETQWETTIIIQLLEIVHKYIIKLNLKGVNLASSNHAFRKVDHTYTINFSSKHFCKKSGFQRLSS